MNLSLRFAKKYLVLFSLLGVMTPVGVRAVSPEPLDQGKVVINIVDENGIKFVGNWFLYTGISDRNLVIRNGNSGEAFSAPAGTYFLEVRNIPSTHNFRSIRSDNPQTLLAGGLITFNVQYFRNEAQKNEADAQPFFMQAPVIPAPVVRITPQPESQPVVVVEPAAKPKPARRTRFITVIPDSNEAPDLSARPVSVVGGETAPALPPRLAVTGPAMNFLSILFASAILGAAFFRKKNA